MKKLLTIFSILGSLSCMMSCKPNLKVLDVEKGNANFERYVAIGNSLTAGYADGALSKEGQYNSYPRMLSDQFMLAGGKSFNIPYMEEGGGSDVNGLPRRVLGYVLPCGSTVPTLSPVLDPAGATLFTNVSSATPYHLIGVPGARAIDANLPIYSSLNPYLQRFCQTPGTSTMLSEALRANPTFFTLWLGSNDVLSYATSGGLPVTSIFSPSLTDTNTLRLALLQLVDELAGKYKAKGAIANIPDITSIPYFTTIKYNGVVLSKSKADTLNMLDTLTHIHWKEGTNGFLIVDSSSPGNIRHATAKDYVLLSTPSDSLRCAGWGVRIDKPLKDTYVLDEQESSLVNIHTNSYNTSIANIAATYGLAHVDINRLMKNLVSGIIYNGISLNATYISGGAFSLDGVHPNARGYAMVANEFIKAINAKYKSTIPSVDASKYQGIIFP
jgi:lysophospholipase L1-like esterase